MFFILLYPTVKTVGFRRSLIYNDDTCEKNKGGKNK